MDCVLFHKKLETGCLKIDLDLTVVINLKMHQIASLGPYFLNILARSMPLDPSWLHSARCQAPVTLNWELATQRLLENTGKQATTKF